MKNRKLKKREITLDMVITFFNCEPYIEEYLEEVAKLSSRLKKEFKISPRFIFVNDGSSDSTLSALYNWLRKNTIDLSCVVLELARNFGQHNAILAGLEEADASFIVIADGDLDQSPLFVLELVNQILSESHDYDVIYTYRESGLRMWHHQTSKSFWSVLSREMPRPLRNNQLSMRIMTREYLHAILQYKSSEILFWGAIFQITGFKQLGLPYTARRKNSTNYNFRKRSIMAKNIFMYYTSLPYKFLVRIVLLVASSITLYLFFQLDELSRLRIENPGWFSLFAVSAVSFLGITSNFILIVYLIEDSKRRSIDMPKYHVARRYEL